MAKKYDVTLSRTTVETAKVSVEAKTEREAAFRAAQAVKPEDFKLASSTIDLGEVQWRETIGSED